VAADEVERMAITQRTQRQLDEVTSRDQLRQDTRATRTQFKAERIRCLGWWPYRWSGLSNGLW
jgi:hypothetical protein